MLALRVAACLVCRKPVTSADTFAGHVTAKLALNERSADLLAGWHDACGIPACYAKNLDGVQGRMARWEPWMGAAMDSL